MSEPLDLEAIKARADAAGPEPWETNGSPFNRRIATVGRHQVTTPNRVAPSALTYDTANFIAHAREDIPALVAEVERLRANSTFDQGYDAGYADGRRTHGPSSAPWGAMP